MNVEACEECRKNFKTRLRMWKCEKIAGRISRPNYENRNMRRVKEEFQYQTMNVKACEDSRKNCKTLYM